MEELVGTRVSAGPRADKSERYPKGTKLYRVVWKGWATDEATWEPAVNISDDVLAEYEAGLDAEAELDAEDRARAPGRGGRRGGRPDGMRRIQPY